MELWRELDCQIIIAFCLFVQPVTSTVEYSTEVLLWIHLGAQYGNVLNTDAVLPQCYEQPTPGPYIPGSYNINVIIQPYSTGVPSDIAANYNVLLYLLIVDVHTLHTYLMLICIL